MKAVSIFLILFLASNPLSAYTFLNSCFPLAGDPVTGLSARQAALSAFSGLPEDGAAALLGNPAWLALNERITFSAGGEFARVSDEVHTAYPDFNDLWNNSFSVWDYGNAGLSVPLFGFLVVGAGYYKEADINHEFLAPLYEFDDSIGSDGEYVRTGVKRQNTQGALYRIPLGLAVSINDFLNFGLSAHVIRGGWETKTITDVLTNRHDPYTVVNGSCRAAAFSAGLLFHPVPYLTIGGFYETSREMKADLSMEFAYENTNAFYSSRSSVVIRHPRRAGINLAFQAGDAYDSAVWAGVTWVNWREGLLRIDDVSGSSTNSLRSLTNAYSFRKETKFSDFYPELRDVFDISFGAEHYFPLGGEMSLPVRYGFFYRPSPVLRDAASTGISLGTGLRMRPVPGIIMQIDLSYSYASSEILDYQEGLYPPVLDGDDGYLRKIRTSINQFMLTLTLKY